MFVEKSYVWNRYRANRHEDLSIKYMEKAQVHEAKAMKHKNRIEADAKMNARRMRALESELEKIVAKQDHIVGAEKKQAQEATAKRRKAQEHVDAIGAAA